jgi:endonuclease III
MNSKKAIAQLKQLEELIPADEKDMRLAAEWGEDWQVLISTILSSQTKDEVTISVSEVLYKKYSRVGKLANANLKSIEQIIGRVNFYKTKARNIRETAKIISENKGEIPEKIEGLLKFPGVGRKVGNVYLAAARNTAAIGVDTHVARLAVKLGWTKAKFSEKHKIEKDLEKLFAEKYWNSINYVLVRFGRSVGRSRKREDEVLKDVKKM